jgi:hypothetical protein
VPAWKTHPGVGQEVPPSASDGVAEAGASVPPSTDVPAPVGPPPLGFGVVGPVVAGPLQAATRRSAARPGRTRTTIAVEGNATGEVVPGSYTGCLVIRAGARQGTVGR